MGPCECSVVATDFSGNAECLLFFPEWSSCLVYDSVRNVHTWSKFMA